MIEKHDFSMNNVTHKAIVGISIALLLASMIPFGLISTSVVAEEPDVWAELGRTNIFTSVHEDSVSDEELTGVYMRSFHIEPQIPEGVDTAKVTLETPLSEGELKPSINYNHPVNFNIDPMNGEWKYTWDFTEPIQDKRADIWMTTYGLEATFTPGFDYQRIVDPILITDEYTTQTVTIVFTPHIDFYNVHLYVVFEDTSEAEVTFEKVSETPAGWFWYIGDPKSVNWQCPKEGVGSGSTYTFSVELNVHNKLLSDPIFYKPHVGSGAFWNRVDIGPSWDRTIWDDVLQGTITYSGERGGDGDDPLTWGLIIQDENTIRFPRFSARAAEEVEVRLQRGYVYEASVFEDSVPNELLDGFPLRNFHIRPQDGVIADARIELVTPWSPERFPSTDYYPPEANFIVEGPEGGPYMYIWDFGSIPNPPYDQAAVWPLRSNIPVELQPNFACQRLWNPWITSHTVTQKLTVFFEPSVPGGVHIQVRAPSTSEASVTIVRDSISASPPLPEHWVEEENGRVVAVNWAGDCAVGTYILTVDIIVANEFYPTPIFYKPSVGIGFGLDPAETPVEIGSNYVTIGDDIDDDGTFESTVTYSGTGSYDWQVIIKRENSVHLPSYSSSLPLMAPLSIKLSGEFDYLEYEDVKIRLAALLTEAISGESVSNADVTLDIYKENGELLVSESMVEIVTGTGIYEWTSPKTIEKLMEKGKPFNLKKGVYLAHIRASLNGGPIASDILEFHIDPPGEAFTFSTTLLIAMMALCAFVVNILILLKQNRKRPSQRVSAST